MGKYGLGIDLGGTKILAGVVNLETGEVLSTAKKKTKSGQGAEEVLDRLVKVAGEALDEAKLPEGESAAGIGVAAAGQVDPETGVLIASPNLGGITDLPIGETLEKEYGLPVTLGNDVQGAALGELHFGAGRGVDRLLCVFIGTGVGGALVQHGELERGITSTAGEIGHTVVQADGRYCSCGARGHLEAYASRTAMTKYILNELRRGRQSVFTEMLAEEGIDENAPGGTAIRSGLLAKALEKDDPLATEALSDAVHFLGLGLSSAINLYNPRRIILGGGVVEAVPSVVDMAGAIAKREALRVPAEAVEIVPAALGDNSGIVGAAWMGVASK